MTHIKVLVGPAQHSNVPATKARLSVRSVESANGSAREVIAASDPITNLSQANAPHVIDLDLSGLPGGGLLAETDTSRYVIKLVAESGASAVVGTTALSVELTWKRVAGSKIGHD